MCGPFKKVNIRSLILDGKAGQCRLAFLYLHHMAGNTIGTIFRLTTFGESHGPAIGGIIDGCPAGLKIDADIILHDLSRRRPGQSSITTQRNEPDDFEILSGIYQGVTTGSPIAFNIHNKDQRPDDYSAMKDAYRPSHADFTYDQKYGHRDHRGSGRASARETAARVFGGSIARQLIGQFGIKVNAYVSAIGPFAMANDPSVVDLTKVETNIVRCPDSKLAGQMIEYLEGLKKEGDTTGGIITCLISEMQAGLGEPVFDKLHADLGKAMLSINAVHGFEYGSGFAGASMRGSEHNDAFKKENGKIVTSSNNSGGIQGGISNGMDIFFRVGFKPVSTLIQPQNTVDKSGKSISLTVEGRHDPCVVPRAVPIVEAMSTLILADHLLRNRNSKIHQA